MRHHVKLILPPSISRRIYYLKIRWCFKVDCTLILEYETTLDAPPCMEIERCTLVTSCNASNVPLTCPDKSLTIKSYVPLVNAKYLGEQYMKGSTASFSRSESSDSFGISMTYPPNYSSSNMAKTPWCTVLSIYGCDRLLQWLKWMNTMWSIMPVNKVNEHNVIEVNEVSVIENASAWSEWI